MKRIGGSSVEATERGMSRRSFLGFAGVGTVAVGAAALTGGMVGCSSEPVKDDDRTTPETPADNTETTAEASYDVFETDLLIIGAGSAGSAVAWSALKSGNQRIMIIEKAPRTSGGHNGNSVTVFNTFIDLKPETKLSEYPASWLGKPLGQYLVNTPLMRNAFDLYKEGARDYDARNRAVTMLNHGQFINRRAADGSIIPLLGDMCFNQRFRHEHDEAMNTGAIQLLDQTMITELLMSDGKCAGVIGLHIPTGRIRVIRAKAVVVTCAGVGANFGRTPVRSMSAMSPDNTFDVEYAAYRHGVGIAECEYGQYDVYGAEPPALSVSCGATLCADAQAASAIYNGKGELVFAPDDVMVNDRNYFAQMIGKAIVEDGGVFIDLKGDGSKVHGITNILEDFGFDVLNQSMAATIEPYDHGGCPVVDENIMTEIPGLFWSRGTGIYGENGGSCIFTNTLFGNYAGYKGAEYALAQEELLPLDVEQVAGEYHRLNGIRTADAENGKRPHEIRHAIQDAFYQGFGTYRTKSALEAAEAELARIRKEDMPLQVLGTQSPVWNRDWKEGIENWSLLLNAEMSIKATLMREESRGGHIRPDFPQQDDKNWSCLIVCKQEGDKMVLSKQNLPALVD